MSRPNNGTFYASDLGSVHMGSTLVITASGQINDAKGLSLFQLNQAFEVWEKANALPDGWTVDHQTLICEPGISISLHLSIEELQQVIRHLRNKLGVPLSSKNGLKP